MTTDKERGAALAKAVLAAQDAMQDVLLNAYPRLTREEREVVAEALELYGFARALIARSAGLNEHVPKKPSRLHIVCDGQFLDRANRDGEPWDVVDGDGQWVRSFATRARAEIFIADHGAQ